MALSDRKSRARLDFLEWEARTHPRRHAVRLFGLALLGYLYPVLLLALSVALTAVLVWLFPLVWQHSMHWVIWVYYALGMAAALALIGGVLRAFYIDLPTPPGYVLPPGSAAPLRAMIEEVRAASDGPKIDQVLLDTRLNAAVAQRPRFGFWGPRTNFLIVGVPLLIALSPQQIRAVLAHEFAHLRGSHNSFTAWIYRIQQTWETLATPFGSGGRLRWLVVGWFVQWYGEYFAISTLALRRIHEYQADRFSADVSGDEQAGDALLKLGLCDYRMGRSFWPATIREASQSPLPPGDVMNRLETFFASPPPDDLVERWRARELNARTPITSEHPCLAFRLDALGCAPMLEQEDGAAMETASESAVSLLGDARDVAFKIVNASWKALTIERWRMEHAGARHARERLERPPPTMEQGKVPGPHDREWERVNVEAGQAPPEQSMQLVRAFVDRVPDHAWANYTLGRLLLEQDDPRAEHHLEIAMRNDSDFVAPALTMLLEYWRELGRDEKAEPIQRRLLDHERALVIARRERLRVGFRDRLLPHELPVDQVEKVCRKLYHFPQIQAAYLARKQVRLFSDKPSYVLAIHRRPRLLEDSRSDKLLVECLAAQMEFPCAVVVLKWRSRRLLSRVLRACPAPIFHATD